MTRCDQCQTEMGDTDPYTRINGMTFCGNCMSPPTFSFEKPTDKQFTVRLKQWDENWVMVNGVLTPIIQPEDLGAGIGNSQTWIIGDEHILNPLIYPANRFDTGDVLSLAHLTPAQKVEIRTALTEHEMRLTTSWDLYEAEIARIEKGQPKQTPLYALYIFMGEWITERGVYLSLADARAHVMPNENYAITCGFEIAESIATSEQLYKLQNV